MNNTHNTVRHLTWVTCLILAIVACTGMATAQIGNQQLPPAGTPWQFDVTGFIQHAQLGGGACGSAPITGPLACGSAIVNGHVITIPANAIVMFPAAQLGWGHVFSLAPAPYLAAGLSGLAMDDTPAPLAHYELHAVGNVVNGTYIAGMVQISQQALNSGAGYITAINPVGATTEMELQINTGDPLHPITKVRINDPGLNGIGTPGRYTKAGLSPDVRFSVDQGNATITSATGFPMCLYPADDATFCPQANRAQALVGGATVWAGQFTMNAVTGGGLDPAKQAPFEVGDYITFAGNLVQDCTVTGCSAGGPTALGTSPYPTAAGSTYISAHTIEDNVAIYTASRVDPSYVKTDVALIGTGGLIVLGAGEAVVRTRFEGMATDRDRIIHLYGVDTPIPPLTLSSDRDWGTIGIDPGPPNGAQQGRWRFRPPCAPFGTLTTKPDKQCVMNQAGTFLPPTQDVKAVLEIPPCPAGGVDTLTGALCPATGAPAIAATFVNGAGNGLNNGFYQAPIGEFIFAENVPGTPVPPADFNGLLFLAQGGYFTSTNPAVQAPAALNPWPGAVAPTPVCPTVGGSAGGPYDVAAGGTVGLFGTATPAGATVLWTSPSGGSFDNPAILTPIFNSTGLAAGTYTLTMTVTLAPTATCPGGSFAATTTVTVNGAATPTVSYTPVNPVFSVPSGTPITLTATGVNADQVTWTQTCGAGLVACNATTNPPPAGTPIVLNPNPKVCTTNKVGTLTCTINFTVNIPLGGTAVTINLAAQAFNTTTGAASAPDTTFATFTPPASTLTVTSVEYRTGKQRLIVNATEQLISPTLNLTLAPYRCQVSTSAQCKLNTTTGFFMYDPSPAAGGLGNSFTNTGGGLYLIDISGAPAPYCNASGSLANYATPCVGGIVTVNASDGGIATSGVTRIRQ